MSGRFVLRPRAQRDIDDIWTYTQARWGIRQAEFYVRQLARHMSVLASGRVRGSPCPELRAGYFKFPSGSHVIFFQPDGDSIEVIRILHASMDIEDHL